MRTRSDRKLKECERELAASERRASRARRDRDRMVSKWEESNEQNKLLLDYVGAVHLEMPCLASRESRVGTGRVVYELRQSMFTPECRYVIEIDRTSEDKSPFADAYLLDEAAAYVAGAKSAGKYSRFRFKERSNPEFPSVISEFLSLKVP